MSDRTSDDVRLLEYIAEFRQSVKDHGLAAWLSWDEYRACERAKPPHGVYSSAQLSIFREEP